MKLSGLKCAMKSSDLMCSNLLFVDMDVKYVSLDYIWHSYFIYHTLFKEMGPTDPHVEAAEGAPSTSKKKKTLLGELLQDR